MVEQRKTLLIYQIIKNKFACNIRYDNCINDKCKMYIQIIS